MSKPFLSLMFAGIGFLAGLMVAAGLMEAEFKRIQHPIDSAIILELPKDEADLVKQLLYLGASKGMLEEIQRQRMVRNETIHAIPSTVRSKSNPHKKGN
jgi:hypothetical protein